jgi:hypothetical protein
MRKTVVIFMLFFVFAFMGVASAIEVEVFNDTFVRGTGAPVTEFRNFDIKGISGPAILKITNGAEDDTYEKVSSSEITVNGDCIFDASNFNQNVVFLESPINLDDNNTLEVLIKGKPGGQIRMQVFKEIAADAAGLISPELGGFIEVTDVESPVYGVQVDIQPGTIENQELITVKEADASTNPPSSITIVGSSVDLGPDGLTFSKPICLTLPYNDSDNDGIIDNTNVSEQNILAIAYDTEGNFENLTIQSQDTVNNTITFPIYHFSIYACGIIESSNPGIVTIDFDDYVHGTDDQIISTQYADLGVIFSSEGGGAATLSPKYFYGYDWPYSNFYCIALTCNYPPGFNIRLDFTREVFGVCAKVMTAANVNVRLTAYDENGNQIAQSCGFSPQDGYTNYAGILKVVTDVPIHHAIFKPDNINAIVGIDDLMLAIEKPVITINFDDYITGEEKVINNQYASNGVIFSSLGDSISPMYCNTPYIWPHSGYFCADLYLSYEEEYGSNIRLDFTKDIFVISAKVGTAFLETVRLTAYDASENELAQVSGTSPQDGYDQYAGTLKLITNTPIHHAIFNTEKLNTGVNIDDLKLLFDPF